MLIVLYLFKLKFEDILLKCVHMESTIKKNSSVS